MRLKVDEARQEEKAQRKVLENQIQELEKSLIPLEEYNLANQRVLQVKDENL